MKEKHMRKTGDIETLFSLLDKKPSGTYQEIVVEEQIQESKRRWPIFERSDVAGHQVQSQEEKRFEPRPEEMTSLPSTPVKQVMPFDLNSTKQPDFSEEYSEKTIKSSLGWSKKLHSGKEEQTTETSSTHLSNLFSKLQKQKAPEKKSIFDKLVKK